MMHLRVISPVDTTDAALTRLRAAGVTNLVVHRGAAVEPQGDVIIADVTRDAASGVVDLLRDLGLNEHGSIALDEVALEISHATEKAEASAPAASDAVIWQQVEQRTGDEARLSATYVTFMIVATLIASFGVLLDQPILIVGAMVVGPEFGPLAALCVGIVRGRWRLAARSGVALVTGFVIGMLATVLTTLLFDALGLIDRSMLLADRPLTDFIWRPDALSWVIAALAGVAGLLSLTAAKSGALIGVVISVTTVPAAANASVAVAYGIPEEALGSLAQLGINLAAIVVGGVTTLLVQRLTRRGGAARLSRRVSAEARRAGSRPTP
jgi:uncharacterized hydrophobic protein (TIGR00271 family)